MKYFLSLLLAFVTFSTCAAEKLAQRTWTIDGVAREGLIYTPATAKSKPAPVIFAFHGHGGTMRNASRSFPMHELWPEAIVVYLQGLNTPGRLTDPEGKKPGWQSTIGELGDCDLKFFDAVLASLKKDYKVDEKRIYSTGHSNGGGFTYLLWAARGDVFAAMAPCSAIANPSYVAKLKPKPVFHIAGESDPLVKFEWQKRLLDEVQKINQCAAGQPWENEKLCTLYPSNINAPLVTYIHPGGHVYPRDAQPLVVKFFQEHTKP